MYNTQFKVKYNEIETELIEKLNNEETTEYNLEDVSDICSKLYRDELMTVFDVHYILDDRIDKGMKNVYEIMMANEKFLKIVYDLEKLIYKNLFKVKTKEKQTKQKQQKQIKKNELNKYY